MLNDTWNNDIGHIDPRHNDTQHHNKNVTLSIALDWLSIYAGCRNYVHFSVCRYTECHSAECRGTIPYSHNVNIAKTSNNA